MRFVLIAAPRTGSSHLCSYLSRHAEILCHGEIFHSKRVQFRAPRMPREERERLACELLNLRSCDPLAFLERIYTMTGGRKNVGFKIFDGHCREALEHLLRDDTTRKIVLFRPNALARYSSQLAAIETETWNAKSSERPKVIFHAEQFARSTQKYLQFFHSTIRILNETGQSYFVIRYDELNNLLMLERLIVFLKASGLAPELKDTAGRASYNVVSGFSNPSEVSEYLEKNRLMHWAYEGDLSLETARSGDLKEQCHRIMSSWRSWRDDYF
jgi:LPS sulfotransferase NodH